MSTLERRKCLRIFTLTSLIAAALSGMGCAPGKPSQTEMSSLDFGLSTPTPTPTSTPAPTATPTQPSSGRVISVGAGKQYATLKAAVTAALAGDTIEVQAGTYTNDYPPLINKNLTIKGVGGKVHFNSTIAVPNRKGIFDVAANVTLLNLEISGAFISNGDGANGAAVRYEGGNLVIDNCNIHHNQNGVMGTGSGSITIKNSQFVSNGVSDSVNFPEGYGYTHGVYVNATQLTVSRSYFFSQNVGHHIKSRSANNLIDNNVIVDGANGSASYDVEFPNGGTAIVQNNLIQKGPKAGNSRFVSFGAEGALLSSSSLKVSGNLFINEKSNSVAIQNASNITATISNNKFYGLSSAQLVSGPNSISGSVILTSPPYAASFWSVAVPSPWPGQGG
ncbi:MAG: hypothetical protein V4692_07425 [Bdellovibrionota bacterium]